MSDLKNRTAIEAKLGRELQSLTDAHRAELEQLLGTPPDVRRVPFAFWEKVRREVNAKLAAELLLIFAASASQHGLQHGIAAAVGDRWARERANRVANGFTANSFNRLQQIAARNDLARVTPAELSGFTSSVFSEGRARGMGINETTVAKVAGSEYVVESFERKSPHDLWMNDPHSNTCEVCAALHETPRSEWELEFPEGPPGPHAGCNCSILYEYEMN